MFTRTYYVYIMTNAGNSVLYTGVTSNLIRRIYAHKKGEGNGFTARYAVSKLVYFETTDSIEAAIQREKQIKAGSRSKKIELVEGMNPEWKELEI
jgi:putative endonuclease